LVWYAQRRGEQPEFLFPEMRRADVKPLAETERDNYCKRIALLAMMLAKKSKHLNIQAKPNANAIARDVTALIDELAAKQDGLIYRHGLSATELREDIAAGLKLLLEGHRD
jgi:hypothetical protein